MTPDEIIDRLRAERDEASARAQLARTEADGADMRLREAEVERQALLARLAAWENVRGDLVGHLTGIVNEAAFRAIPEIHSRAADALALIPPED